MNRAEVRDLNRRLFQFGMRYCPGCGATLALTQGHWYFSRRGRDRALLRASSLCKRCARFKTAERERKRYQRDAAFRQQKSDYRRAYFANPARLQRHRERGRAYMRAKRNARFIRIVQVVNRRMEKSA